MLTPHGFEVIDAATGQDGLTAAATVRPDLIILDLGLPDLSGVLLRVTMSNLRH